jgi:hypothetical protein
VSEAKLMPPEIRCAAASRWMLSDTSRRAAQAGTQVSGGSVLGSSSCGIGEFMDGQGEAGLLLRDHVRDGVHAQLGDVHHARAPRLWAGVDRVQSGAAGLDGLDTTTVSREKGAGGAHGARVHWGCSSVACTGPELEEGTLDVDVDEVVAAEQRHILHLIQMQTRGARAAQGRGYVGKRMGQGSEGGQKKQRTVRSLFCKRNQ